MSVTVFALRELARYISLDTWGVQGMMRFFTRMWPTVFFTVVCVTKMGTTVYADLGVKSNDVNMNFVSTNINWILDKFLSEYRKSTIESGNCEIKLDDIHEEFERILFIVYIYGTFDATNGRLKNLSTIQRTGDATLNESGGKVIVGDHLELQDLQIYFKKFKIFFFNIDDGGSIQATIRENSVYMELTIAYKPECSVTLTKLHLEKLDNIDVEVTGLSYLSHFADNISSWVINNTQNFYRAQLESVLFSEMSQAVIDADICQHLPF